MNQTSPFPAATPEAAYDTHDIVAEVLRSVRLTGSVFLNACFTAPFGVISPKRFDEGTPMAHLRQISVFHLIAAGTCTFGLATGEHRAVSAGDVVLMPFADAHRFWSGDFETMVFAPELVRPGPIKGMWTIDHGGGGEATRMVCGFVESSDLLCAPLFRSLPRLLVDRADDKVSTLITTTVRDMLLIADAMAPGAELMLGRLM